MLGIGLGLTSLKTRGSALSRIIALFSDPAATGWVYDNQDLTTMFQDVAGTVPAISPGQRVRLQLDKSKGLVLGPELVTNGDFATDSDWTKGTGWAIGSGSATLTGTQFSRLTQLLSTVAGRAYKVVFSALNVSSTAGVYARSNTADGTTLASKTDISTAGEYSIVFVAGSSTTALFFTQMNNSGVTSFSIDNISVRELPGNHRRQPSGDASAPILGRHPAGGRRNLLTWTEQFENPYWLKNGSTTVSANTIVAPDGTLTADRVSGASGTDFTGSVLRVNSLVIPTSSSNTLSAHVVADGATTVRMYYRDGTTGIVYSTAAISLTASWQRITLSVPTANGGILFWGAANGNFGIWGAQLELGATATPYQRVTIADDCTEAGVADRWYLRADGADDWLETSAFAWGSDKATICAGVRKLSDAAAGVVLELSASLSSFNGSVLLAAPGGAGSGRIDWSSKGTVKADAQVSGLATPMTVVATGIGDIAGDVSTLRINGVLAQTTVTDQGTGNFGTYPAYFFRRGGTSLPFNGFEYANIGINRLLTPADLALVEGYVTGVTL